MIAIFFMLSSLGFAKHNENHKDKGFVKKHIEKIQNKIDESKQNVNKAIKQFSNLNLLSFAEWNMLDKFNNKEKKNIKRLQAKKDNFRNSKSKRK